MWTRERFEAAAKIKALRDAGFSNADIVEAKRVGLLDELAQEAK